MRVPFLLGGFAVALSAAGPVAAQTDMVRYVTDGDTFRLTSNERIRISGIDAPETQPGQAKCAREIVLGKRAAARLRDLIDGRTVTLNRVGRSYNRTVATVSGGRGEAVAARPAQARLVPLMDWHGRFAGDPTLAALLTPTRLYTAAEAGARGIGAPRQPGIYAWYFDAVPPGVDARLCHRHGDWTLLYCGISPKKPPARLRRRPTWCAM